MIVSSGSRKRCESSLEVNRVLVEAFNQRNEYAREELLELLYQKVKPELLASINIIRREWDAKARGKPMVDWPNLEVATLIRRGSIDGLNSWMHNRIMRGQLKKITRGRGDWSVIKLVDQISPSLVKSLKPLEVLVLNLLKEHQGKAMNGSELMIAIRETGALKTSVNMVVRNLREQGHVIATERRGQQFYYTLNDSP